MVPRQVVIIVLLITLGYGALFLVWAYLPYDFLPLPKIKSGNFNGKL